MLSSLGSRYPLPFPLLSGLGRLPFHTLPFSHPLPRARVARRRPPFRSVGAPCIRRYIDHSSGRGVSFRRMITDDISYDEKKIGLRKCDLSRTYTVVENDVIALLNFNNCPGAKKIRDPNSCAAVAAAAPAAAGYWLPLAAVVRCDWKSCSKYRNSLMDTT